MGTELELGHDSRLSIPEHVLTRQAAGETVLLNLDNEEYYGLDGVGSRLWELIEAGTTYGQAITTVLDEYEVTREELEADLMRVVNDLHANGLVLVDPS